MDPAPAKPPDEEDAPEQRRSLVGPVAAVGALAALVAGAVRLGVVGGASPSPAPAAGAAPGKSPVGPELQLGAHRPPAATLPRQYKKVMVLGGDRSSDAFRFSLAGVAIGAGDSIYALGDNEVRVFDPGGTRARTWKVVENAACVAVASDGRVLVGAGSVVHVYDATGGSAGSFPVGPADRPGQVTAIKVHRDATLVADAAHRVVRRLDAQGREVCLIGNRDKTNGFMLPNRWLDLDVDAAGIVYATDTGRHQVTSWTLDGAPVGKFGKFGMLHAEDFVGCCNPVNLALLPDGGLVTAEKVAARVKVFGADRQLLAVIGPEHFNPNSVHIHVAVDSKGRILAGDPLRGEIAVFAL